MATSNKNFKVKNGLDVSGAATAESFVKAGGSAAQFLMADGSISDGAGSLEVSPTPPESPSEGDIWYNSTTGQTFVYYDSYWVENVTGQVGPQGPTGATGPAGQDSTVPGPQGEPGADGFIGADGAEGPPGPEGPQGPEGPEGPAGTFGVLDEAPVDPNEGDVWFNTSDGRFYVYYDDFWVEALSNEAGPQGPEGPAGADGADGADSTVPGPEGPQGPAGADGADGADGATGPEGPQGPAGADGADGADGDTGETGVVISESEPASTDVLWLDSDAVAEVPVPVGGTAGQVLAKSSSTDYDTEWSTINAADISDITASAAALNSTSSATSGLTALSNGTNGITYQPVSYNAIINGAFDIWQRGTSFSISQTYLGADRWQMDSLEDIPSGTYSQQSFSPGELEAAGNSRARFYQRIDVTNPRDPAQHFFRQPIEDVRTFAGQTVTISFYAKAAATTTLQTRMVQFFGTGGSSAVTTSPVSHSVTTSWQRFTAQVEIASLSGKTIGTNNALRFEFMLPMSVFTLDLWGVQLEAGAVATPFKRNAPSIQAELAACQRYYEAGSHPFEYRSVTINAFVTVSHRVTFFKVTKRVSPSVTVTRGASDNAVAGNGVMGGVTNDNFVHTIGINDTNFPYVGLAYSWTAAAEL